VLDNRGIGSRWRGWLVIATFAVAGVFSASGLLARRR
jgi:hypothetical protein